MTSPQLSWRNSQLNAVGLDEAPEIKDDGSLYKLIIGFALHVSIKFVNKALYGHICSWFHSEKDVMNWN